ncbi:hypothetical protein MVEN_01129400 [Mycena venus]|uniref:Uncharacterized protein n=1 Tax=Mycena venus TaxID=2733690 RepID=A0A8H6Y8K8_9AGAR|nr:hypothetical protein MVEN_01129400 [Mycena venus]
MDKGKGKVTSPYLHHHISLLPRPHHFRSPLMPPSPPAGAPAGPSPGPSFERFMSPHAGAVGLRQA